MPVSLCMVEGCSSSPVTEVNVWESMCLVSVWAVCQPNADAIHRGDMFAAPEDPWQGNLGLR